MLLNSRKCVFSIFGNTRLPRWHCGKESACQSRWQKRQGFNPLVRKITWRRKWQPLQYSCLENPMNRGAWRATVHGVTKSQTRLSDWAGTYTHTTSFFIRSSVAEHLGWFHVLVIVNSAEMNIGIHVSFWIMAFSGCTPRSGRLDRTVALILIF